MGFTINAEVRMKNEECKPWKPTREQLLAANGKTLPDLIAPNLKVLFAGINPGLYTAAVGHHFGRPGNRFWPALHRGGFTPRVFSPFEEEKLLALGYGIVNVVDRASVAADVLTREEYELGAKKLEAKGEGKFTPRFLALVGIGAYRMGFQSQRREARATGRVRSGETKIWVLPNPSGLNAHHTPGKAGEIISRASMMPLDRNAAGVSLRPLSVAVWFHPLPPRNWPVNCGRGPDDAYMVGVPARMSGFRLRPETGVGGNVAIVTEEKIFVVAKLKWTP